jgi:hypothetical protein
VSNIFSQESRCGSTFVYHLVRSIVCVKCPNIETFRKPANLRFSVIAACICSHCLTQEIDKVNPAVEEVNGVLRLWVMDTELGYMTVIQPNLAPMQTRAGGE